MTTSHIVSTLACILILALCVAYLVPVISRAYRTLWDNTKDDGVIYSDERPSYDIEYGCTVKDHELV